MLGCHISATMLSSLSSALLPRSGAKGGCYHVMTMNCFHSDLFSEEVLPTLIKLCSRMLRRWRVCGWLHPLRRSPQGPGSNVMCVRHRFSIGIGLAGCRDVNGRCVCSAIASEYGDVTRDKSASFEASYQQSQNYPQLRSEMLASTHFLPSSLRPF